MRDVIDYYERFADETRLTAGASLLEFERTKEDPSRLLKTSGLLVVAAISRYASALDGLARSRAKDRNSLGFATRTCATVNTATTPTRWTTSRPRDSHRPEDLRQKMLSAGFDDVKVLGVEGAGWMVADFSSLGLTAPVARARFAPVGR